MRVGIKDNSYIILFQYRVGDLLSIVILVVFILEGNMLIPLIAVFFEEHLADHVLHPILVIMPGLLSAGLNTEKGGEMFRINFLILTDWRVP